MGRVGWRRATALAVTLALLTGVDTAAGQRDPRSMGDGRASDPASSSVDAFVAEAAVRFAIPERWIRVVLQAESAGDPQAVSRAGAMGLMQIMPATWRELRRRHGLGADPFDPRDNILAGAAYLRAMADRFGSPGFLAAYNAGPERYAEHRATGRPLPRETRAYLAKLAPLIDGPAADPPSPKALVVVADWRAAPIFVVRSEMGPDAGSASDGGFDIEHARALCSANRASGDAEHGGRNPPGRSAAAGAGRPAMSGWIAVWRVPTRAVAPLDGVRSTARGATVGRQDKSRGTLVRYVVGVLCVLAALRIDRRAAVGRKPLSRRLFSSAVAASAGVRPP